MAVRCATRERVPTKTCANRGTQQQQQQLVIEWSVANRLAYENAVLAVRCAVIAKSVQILAKDTHTHKPLSYTINTNTNIIIDSRCCAIE